MACWILVNGFGKGEGGGGRALRGRRNGMEIEPATTRSERTSLHRYWLRMHGDAWLE
jgi:hypothetical protein